MLRVLTIALALLYAGPVLAEQGAYNAPTNQAFKVRVVTPSNTVNLVDGRTIGVFNGTATACDIAMILYSDSAAVTWSNVQSGAILPVRATRIMAANTTCTSILALY